MNRQRLLQRYRRPESLERLLLLLAVFVKYPGIGRKDEGKTSGTGHHQALESVQSQLRALAQSLGLDYPPDYPAIPTLRKDLELLRTYGLLEQRMYRWGYYLGAGVLSAEELQIAFNALESQALFQGHPLVKQVYLQLKQRLRGFALPENRDFFYPVRQHLNRAINYTDPQEMMAKAENRHTLYHSLEAVEEAILRGQALRLYRIEDPYRRQGLGPMDVYPLQLFYYDIAWYLLSEDCHNGCLATGRVNRFSDQYELLPAPERGSEAQRRSLQAGYRLLENGWGLNLGTLTEQQAELAGTLELIPACIRFYPPASSFIWEGDRRHPRQKIKLGPGKPVPKYLDYRLDLPPRSLGEFAFWVQRYGDKAIVLAPLALQERHRQGAEDLARCYQALKENIP
jgi:predicted DNA-binding transcriptional regulator YafY